MGFTIKQKKENFLYNYAKYLNKTKAMNGLFSATTLYKYMNTDDNFRAEIESIELSVIHRAEAGLSDLLDSKDEKIKLAAIDKLLNSKIGSKHSNFAKAKKDAKINIETDKIEYTIND